MNSKPSIRGHFDVEQDHVRIVVGQHLQGIETILCRQRAIAFALEQPGGDLADGERVIHDQHHRNRGSATATSGGGANSGTIGVTATAGAAVAVAVVVVVPAPTSSITGACAATTASSRLGKDISNAAALAVKSGVGSATGVTMSATTVAAGGTAGAAAVGAGALRPPRGVGFLT